VSLSVTEPAAQGEHTEAPADEYVPAAQLWQASPFDEYVPARQSAQALLDVEPAAQVEPSTHVEQVVASEVCPATYFPTAQIVHPDPGVDVASPEYPAAQRLHAFADAVFV
jgi:hypothetical protein